MGLEDLISHPKIWKARSGYRQLEAISTGFPELDRALPGAGWPRKAITEIFIARYGIGELGLLMPALASLEQANIAWIAPPYLPYAPALVHFGLDLNRMLMVHPATETDIPWVIEEIVRSQSQAIVLAWLPMASERTLRRLQLIVEERQAWAVLFRPATMLQQKSPAALKLRLAKHGEQLRIEIIKCRGGRPGVVYVAVHMADMRGAG